MNIPEDIRKSVAFVGMKLGEEEPVLSGTCFFVLRESARVENFGWVYAITARHVIDGIAQIGGEVILRVNTTGAGATWLPSPRRWFTHFHDNSIDVAAMAMPGFNNIDHQCYPISDRVGNAGFGMPGIGDELFFPGLFVGHSGKERNIPIVRTGHIAAMPEEQIAARLHSGVQKIDAYLIESRSIGGLSGSPVFNYVSPQRDNATASRVRYLLMGMVQGHFDVVDAPVAGTAVDEARVNMGIGIVVPAEKIAEVLSQREILERETVEEQAELDKARS